MYCKISLEIVSATRGKEKKKKKALFKKKKFKIIKSKYIILAGGPDPSVNNKLQATLNRAKAAGMPKDNIENALKKGSDKNKDGLENVLYECVGPGGIALIV
jgi:transcriptional/translational regulatory protein YebC/TACO1